MLFTYEQIKAAHAAGLRGEEDLDRWLTTVIREEEPLEELNFSVRLYNAMRRHGVKTVGQARYLLRADGDTMGDHAIDWKNIGWPTVEAGRCDLEEFDKRFARDLRDGWVD